MTIIKDGELVLYGSVGASFFGERFFEDIDVLEALEELGDDADITVRVNSGGGYTDQGIAIYNALKAHGGEVTVVVDGVAASAASLISMAGDQIIMRRGATMMLHDPSGFASGMADEIAIAVRALDRIGAVMASIYAEQSGDDPDDLRKEMKAELWLTGEEAVKRGFATASEDVKAAKAAAFDYGAYAHSPKKLVAMASKRNWKLRLERPMAAFAASLHRQSKETESMANPPQNVAPVAAAPTSAAPAAPAVPPAASVAAPQVSQDAAVARVQEILTHSAAQGAARAQAEHLAFNCPQLDAQQAVAVLEAGLAPSGAPVDAAQAQASQQGAAPVQQPASGGYEANRLNQMTATLAQPQLAGAGDPSPKPTALADAVGRLNKKRR